MNEEERIRLAEAVVKAVQRRLPGAVREVALKVPVVFHAHPTREILGAEFPPDILGLFVGAPEGVGGEGEVSPAAHILLFIENLWDFAEGDPSAFREEVRITYLHELGHYLGWDETDVAERGLE